LIETNVIDGNVAETFTFSQAETLHLDFVAYTANQKRIKMPEGGSCKMEAWIDGTPATLYVQKTGTINTTTRKATVTLSRAESNMPVGDYLFTVKVFDSDDLLTGIIARGTMTALYSPQTDSVDYVGTSPAIDPDLDFASYDSYSNTATHGPVRPDGSTLEVATTNADGSINLGVKDGVYRSVFDLLGTWDPVANSPTLTDGTGNEGDIYFIQGLNGNTYSVDTGSGAQTYTARRFVRYASGVWIPEGDPNYVWQDYFAVSGYAFATGETVDATTEPSDWPSRIHFVTSSAGIAEGWPVDNALIVTSKATTARAVQMVYEFGVATPKAYFRSWDGATWTAFKQFAYDDDVVKLTPTPSTIQTLNGGSGFTQLNITGESGYLAVGRTTSGGEAVHVVRDETTSGSWQVGILTTAKESEHSAYEIYRNETGNLFVGFWVSQVDKLCRAVYGLVAPIIKSAEATGLVVQDSAGTEKLKVGASTGADVQVTGDLSVTEKQATVYSLSDSRDATMSGDETLTTASATNQYLDPADADRNLDLPNASVFIISNVGDGAEIITVRDESDVTIDTIDNGITLRFQWTGSAWRVS
jgi:hypothetical protein